MSSLLRRSGTKLLKLLSRAAAPLPFAGEVRLYAQQISGLAQFYVSGGSGLISQMTGPGAVTPTAYFRGLATSWISVTQVQIAAGRARARIDTVDIVLAAAITANITAAGVNGLDAGVEAASTWYHLFIIGDSTNVLSTATLISASATAPTLPAGYDVFRRVGSVRNSAGSDFLRFTQVWNGRTRRHWYDESLATLQVLTNGSAIAATAVSCSTRAPTTCTNVVFEIEFLSPTIGGAASDLLALWGSSVGAPGPFQRIGALATSSLRWTAEMVLDLTQQVFYTVSDVDDIANLYVLAYDDEL